MNRTVNRPLLKRLVKGLGKRGTGKLADKANVGQSTIEKLMAGSYSSYPKDLTRLALCEALCVTEDDLFPVVGSRRKTAS